MCVCMFVNKGKCEDATTFRKDTKKVILEDDEGQNVWKRTYESLKMK